MIFDDRYDSNFKTPLKRTFTLTTFLSGVGQVGKRSEERRVGKEC